MDDFDQKIQRVVNNLAVQTLCFRTKHTPSVYAYFQDLLNYLQSLAERKLPRAAHLQCTYDLLLIHAAKIEQIYQEKNWTVDQLLLLLDDCAKHDEFPELSNNDHLLQRAVITHNYLSLSDRFDLGKHAYERLKNIFMLDINVPFRQKIKMTLGNIFAGPHNIAILANIYPYLLQLRIPVGPLKKELNIFLNRLMTGIMVTPKLNNAVSVLTTQNNYLRSQGLLFNFKECLEFLNAVTQESIFSAIGLSPQSEDVRLVRTKISLIKQVRGVLAAESHLIIDMALADNKILRKHLKTLFSKMQDFRPVYTWGSALDEAINDLLDEVKLFSKEMMSYLDAPDQGLSFTKPVWNMMEILFANNFSMTATLDSAHKIFHRFLPRIYTVMKFLFPDDQVSLLLTKCKIPILGIFEHGRNLMFSLEKLGVFHSVVQAVLLPLRGKILSIELEPLQRLAAIYWSQFEQFIEQPENAKQIWTSMSEDQKRELLMNLAATLNQLSILVESVLPFLSSDTLACVRDALNTQPNMQTDFDGMLVEIMKLQDILRKDADVLMQTVLDIFSTSGDKLTVGHAATSVVSSHGGVVNAVVGHAVGGVVDVISGYRLDLAFNPSESGVLGIPQHWAGKNLKIIFKDEIHKTFGLIKRFNEIKCTEGYLKQSSVAPVANTV